MEGRAVRWMGAVADTIWWWPSIIINIVMSNRYQRKFLVVICRLPMLWPIEHWLFSNIYVCNQWCKHECKVTYRFKKYRYVSSCMSSIIHLYASFRQNHHIYTARRDFVIVIRWLLPLPLYKPLAPLDVLSTVIVLYLISLNIYIMHGIATRE